MENPLRILVVGDSGVGKSSFIGMFCGTDCSGSTLSVAWVRLRGERRPVIFLEPSHDFRSPKDVAMLYDAAVDGEQTLSTFF